MGGSALDPQLMLLSGFCLEMLDTAGRAPLDSRTAIGRAITQVGLLPGSGGLPSAVRCWAGLLRSRGAALLRQQWSVLCITAFVAAGLPFPPLSLSHFPLGFSLRPLPQVLKQLADALKELGATVEEAAEALQQQDKGEGEGQGEGGGGAPPAAANGRAEDADDGSEGGFGFDQEDFDAGQLAVARGVRGLLAEAVGLLKLLVKQLLAER